MFRIFSGNAKTPPAADLSAIGVDMHSHLIPGIDDGVQTVEESLALIRQYRQAGFRKLITTPHVNVKFPNTPAIIRAGHEQVKAAVEAAGIDITVEAAAEYLIEDGFEQRLEKMDFLTFGDQQMLIELSYFIPYPALSQVVYELQSAGYSLILAHAERYAYWHHNFSIFEDLMARDIRLQVNLSSLTGRYGVDVRNAARKLISLGWISYAGSDVHNQEYFDAFLKGAGDKYAVELMGGGGLRNAEL